VLDTLKKLPINLEKQLWKTGINSDTENGAQIVSAWLCFAL
jgi:hypothetical protein